MQILEALAKYQVQLEANGRSGHTIAQYRRHVRALARWAADVGHSCDLADIGHEDVARFMAAPVARTRPDGRKKKATAMNALRTSVRTFFRYLHEAGLIPANPAQILQRARCAPPPPRALSDDEGDRMLGVLEKAEGPEAKRDHMLVHLMLETGLRIGSAIGLDVEDVDLERGEVAVRATKGNRPDFMVLSHAIRDHLTEYLDDGNAGPLFTGRAGRRISIRHAQRRFTEWLKKADITRPASLHSLRHTFACRVYRRTGDLLITQQALRHRSIASTTVYARCDDRQLRAAIGA